MVRPNELSFARRGALNKLAARRQGARPSQLTAVFVGVDPEDDSRVIVSFDGSEVSVLAGPVRMTPGALCAVEVDSANAPVRVIGPVTTRPAGLDEDVEAPAPVTAMPELAPREGMTEEELQRLQDTADDLAQAREDLVDARAEAERNFGTLDDKLGQAFPTGPFDVGAEITSSASATLTAAALDAQAKANDAASAARDAAQQYADGEISDAELRAARDAEAKANAARDAAVATANAHADDAASAAEQAALSGAQAYADQKKTEAIQAAATDAQTKADQAAAAAQAAAEEHADLVAQGASQAAIDAAALDAQEKATAAENAAKAHADAQAQAAEDAAKTHATNEAARVKQEALTEAATDAQTKAENAAQAAEAAAKAYAELQASGASADALADAKVYADTKKSEAISAAEDSALAYAEAAKNAAIDAAALTAQTKADVAKQAAIDAAQENLDALEVGGRNLIIRSTETENTWIDTTGSVVTNNNNATSDYIRVPDSGVLTLTRTHAPGDAYFRLAWYDENKVFISREARGDTPTTRYAPEGAVYMRVSYPKDAQVKAERGTKATDWSPAPEDVDAGIAEAQAKADSAYSYAVDVEDMALNANTTASTAMTTADGKNTTTYEDVTTAPGPTPTTASGSGRRLFDMHRNRLSDGTVVAEWMWSGTDWVPVHMGDGMLRSLDVGKLTAGTANIETAVINRLWTQLGVFDKLDVRQDAYVSGINLKDGAVTARTLNVVHTDSDTGSGWRAEPEGLTFLDENGSPSITLRTDMTNSFSVMEDGVSVASISEEGDVTGRSVAANESLLYRTEELADLLMVPARGIISHSVANGNISIGTSEGRVVSTTFRTPPDDRMVTVQYNGYLSNSGSRRGRFDLRQSTGNSVTPANSSKAWWRTNTQWAESINHSVTMSVSDWGWPLDGTITVGIFAYSETSGETLAFSWGRQELIVRDEGPAVVTQTPAPWAPSTGGGDGTGTETQPGTREYSPSYDATSHKTYSRSSTNHVRAGKSLVQGYVSGVTSRGHWIFPASTIKSAISGTTELSGSLTIRNEHTYSSAGMTAVLKVHNYSSAPSTFGTTQNWTSVSVPRGRAVTIKLPSWILDGLKAGTIKGFSLDSGTSTSNSYYGYFSPKATLSFKYKK